MARLQSGSSSSANKPPSKPHPHPQSQPQNPQVARHRTRHRSYSDPFSDPVHQARPVPRLPPEPPPKYPPHSKMTSTNKQPPHRDNIVDAVRDTVQLRSSEQSSRPRTGRSQTVVASVSLLFSSAKISSPHPQTATSLQVLPVHTVGARCLKIPSCTPPMPWKRQRESLVARRVPFMQTS